MQIVYSIHVCSGGSREANGGNCPPLASHTLGGALLRRAMKNTVQYIISLQYFCFSPQGRAITSPAPAVASSPPDQSSGSATAYM